MADILQSTNKKIDAVLAKIDSIAESGSAQQPGSEALLDRVREVFAEHKELVRAQEGNSPSVQRMQCRRAIEAIDAYLPILGFVSRASDLDGPVELYGPLWDLTIKALGPDSKLIISPEWDYSPLTILFPQLSARGYVLVGLPGCEANNALLTPLAGHELGHNIWAAAEMDLALRDLTRKAIIDSILETRPAWIPVQLQWKGDLLSDLSGEAEWSEAWQSLLRQCEEAFCDLVGLLLFRESFLHATEYLMTPTLTENRNSEYPTSKNRVRALVSWSEKIDPRVDVPSDYSDRFDDEKLPKDEKIRLADIAFPKLVDELFERAHRVVTERALVEHNPGDISKIQAAFEQVVPATNVKSLSDIINAGWSVYLNNPKFVLAEYPGAKGEPHQYLNELILKTIEVLEIERRTAAA